MTAHRKRILTIALVLSWAATAPGQAADRTWRWNFDEESPMNPPSHFEFALTGKGRAGKWQLREERDAPSGPHILAQLDEDPTNQRVPLAIAMEPSLRDLKLSVKCKPVYGNLDQACGLVFRYRDEATYYLARSNVLQGTVRLYAVKDGKRTQIGGWTAPANSRALPKKGWHDLAVEARGDALTVQLNGKRVIDTTDKVHRQAGRVGVATEADSQTWFDDLQVVALK